ncbi:MAG TPA: inositol 2-dehydrogenase [Candidatus Cybelea sp.]|nr:inositol 2-dehydrogenase [Candidatus Cybelea sp.]
MLEIALIGAGRIGQIHGRNIAKHPGARLRWVTDVNTEAAGSLAQELGAQSGADAVKAIQDPAVNAVAICSPTDTHAEMIETAAKAGKAIFCEKPIDLSLERVNRCLDVVKKAGVTMMIGFNRRFDANFAAVHEGIRSGKIGKLETLIITSRDPGPPPIGYIKQSGGLFKDMMIHDFDMARWLLGEEPTEVYATASNLVDPEIGKAGDIDTAMVILKTRSGCIGQIGNSRRAVYGYDQRIEAFGSKGMLQAGNETPTTVAFSGEPGVVSDKPLHFFLERYADAYRSELQHFIDCVLGKAKPATSIEDGRHALALAEAAVQSLKIGQPVKV